MLTVIALLSITAGWLLLGFIGAAMEFTEMMFDFPILAEEYYERDARRCRGNIFFGLTWFLLHISSRTCRKAVRENGLWWPGEKARTKARELAARAHREQNESIIQEMKCPEAEREQMRQVLTITSKYPDADRSAIWSAVLTQKPPEGTRLH